MAWQGVDATVGANPDARASVSGRSAPVPTPVPLLQLEGVTIQYKTPKHLITATYRVGFDVYERDRFVLLGPSGCGKSTLLKAIGGFIHPVEGSIRLRGQQVVSPGPDRALVFQEFDQLLPWLTVEKNITFALLNARRCASRAEAGKVAIAFLKKVHLEKFGDAYPHMLSGGMKQRVAIARAMAVQPDVLLMDEPFAALDALTRSLMQEELLRLWEELRFSLILVTHSIDEALIVGSRILVLSPHPGRIKAELNSPLADDLAQQAEVRAVLHRKIHDMLFAPSNP